MPDQQDYMTKRFDETTNQIDTKAKPFDESVTLSKPRGGDAPVAGNSRRSGDATPLGL
jgi:hypothetical protein